MNKTLLLLALLLISLGLYAWPVRIQSWDLDKDIKTLNQNGFSIDYVNRSNGVIHVYVRDANEADKLNSFGFAAERMPDLAKEYALQLWEETKDSKDPMRAYYTLTEYQNFMQQTAAQYPEICQLVQFGTSIQGRPLYFMKISDNVSQEENEPELKYVGSIHGDEVVGYDMLLRLIQLLTSQYGSNTRITNIVNNTEIWINPMFNPDGNALVQRYNANGVDLNRNFPTPNGNQHPDGNATQVENIAMMEFSSARDFDLSINFHGGALVINYPWDYTYTLAPDDALLREMSLTYSRQNTPMYNSTEFPQGVTNGAAWYIIDGGMQDWNYYYTDCFELTGEISNVKWPPASQLDTFWAQNQESMLQYIEFAQRGVHGLVTNGNGTPIQANITVTGNAKVVKNDLPVGDYHRLLLPGTYQITASATGYISQTAQVTVPTGGGTIQNFVLEPAMLTSFHGQVRNLQGFPLTGATVTIQGNPVLNLQTDAQGLFTIDSIFEGSYNVNIQTPDLAPYNGVLSVSHNDSQNTIFVLQPPIFSDDFESGIGNWTVTGTWGIVANSGSNVLTDSPSGNYSNNQNRACRLTNPVNMSGVMNAGLSFRCKYVLESGYDFVYVEVSTNNSNWTQIGSFTGTQSTWTNQYFSLANFTSGNLYIRFRLVTDNSQTADGIYIDDVQISGNGSSLSVYGDVTGDGCISMADIEAIVSYSIGMDPIPNIDPRPWEAFRLTNADVDINGYIDAFDGYLLCKYKSVANYLLPVQSGNAEPVNDPGLSVSYNGNLQFNFADIDQLKSFTFSTSPNDLVSVSHQGFPQNNNYVQVVNQENDSYAFAGYNIDQESLFAVLGSNPQNFTLLYTVNGVAGAQFVNVGSASDDQSSSLFATSLLPNIPNPFNPSTTIHFTLSEPTQKAQLSVYNLKGQKVKSLLQAELKAGKHSVVWDGKDDSGKSVGSGIYFLRLQSDNIIHTRKILLSK